MTQNNTRQTYIVSIAILAFMFFIFGFVSWINAILIPYFKIACNLTNFQAYLVAFSFYIAYLIMSMPGGLLLKKYGLKKGIMYGFFALALGALVFVPAALTRTYGLFLTGLFIMGTGLAILQTAANPYVTIIGPIDRAAQRMSIMGVCNKFAGILSPLIFAGITLKSTDSELFAALPTMTESASSAALDELIRRVILPYICLSVLMIGVGLFIRYSVLPEINTEDESEEVAASHGGKTNIFQFPYLVLGALAIFLHVGTQVIAIDTIIGYAGSMGLDLIEAKAFPSYTLTATIIGYILGIICIPKFINQTYALRICTVTGLLFSICILLLPGEMFFSGHEISLSIWFVVLLGLPNALIYAGIWPLAIRDLGRFTKMGSSLLIMGLAGNAILPLIYGYFADTFGLRQAYCVLIPCFLYLIFYSFYGHKINEWKRPEKSKLMKYTAYCLFSLWFISCNQGKLPITDLQCENLTNPEGLNTLAPRFSWKKFSASNEKSQIAYQILVASDPALLHEEGADMWNSGRIDSEASVLIPYGGKALSSRSLGFWKVRVWDEDGNPSWSELATFSVGLLHKSDWQASFIALPVSAGSPESPLLLKRFEWKKEGIAKLHVNSLGYHEVWLNGEKVGDAVLTPAVSQLDKRSLINTYDLTSCLRKGENELILWLGQGWYRPWLPGGQYEGPVVRAQMDVKSNDSWDTFILTDNSWKGKSSGYSSIGTWKRGTFGGEKVDASLVPEKMTEVFTNEKSWYPVVTVDVPDHEATPQMSGYNRLKETILPVSVSQIADSTFLVDMGKNMTGWAEIKFSDLTRGDEVRMEYFDQDDGFVKCRQSDLYIASGKQKELFVNKFNYHGFRYIKLSNLCKKPELRDIKGYFIQEDFPESSSFVCSDTDMNAIHDMIHYTLRCLSMGGYMVDCPHLERLGYGGDGNASTITAQTLFDLSPLYANWLQAWADCIQPDGDMPHTAPNPYRSGGGPYWCGFLVQASWNTYINYGDRSSMDIYYPVMKKWFEYVEAYSPKGLLERWPDNNYRQWYLGDWAVPDSIDEKAEASVQLVNNCAIVQCYETMSKIADVLGETSDAEIYTAKKERLCRSIHQAFFNSVESSYATATQIDLVYPMLAGATPDSLIKEVNARFFQEVELHNGHLACGLVGVPVLTEWLTTSGQKDLMYSMLKKREYPGYLYMIDNGATTTWEHWSGKRSHIHNCYNGIGSWFYRAIGGICPDEKFPAYEQFYIKPQIPQGITWAKVTKETPYGTIVVGWKLEDEKIYFDVSIPSGSRAEFVLPEGVRDFVVNGEKYRQEKEGDTVLLRNGNHTICFNVGSV